MTLLIGAFFSVPTFAVSESDVEAQVAASGKEAVTGNVLIWFLCAVAFLKVSQKIDSFMASLGVNVGHTGGSLMAEALIATRGITTVAGIAGHSLGGVGRGSSGSSGAQSVGGYFKGGLAGMASRRAANNAVKTATNNTTIPTPHSTGAQSRGTSHSSAPGAQEPIPAQASTLAQSPRLTDQSKAAPGSGTVPVPAESEEQHPIVLTDGAPMIGAASGSMADASPEISSAGSDVVIDNSEQSATITEQAELQAGSPGIIQTATQSSSQMSEKSSAQSNNRTSERSSTSNSASRSTHTSSKLMPSIGNSFKSYGIGGAMFMKSLSQGGGFANDVIGRVARGDIQTTGTISGEMATQALNSYMGVTAMGADAGAVPSYSHVEIGGGRISGLERAAGTHQDVQFHMYDASQYVAPQGEHTKVVTADGATWYKQYEQDAVDRKPYMAPDGAVAYNETIVKRMPNPPQRKSRL